MLWRPLRSHSGLVEAIDEAFVDRADICRYVGNPGLGARYSILCSCVEEMMRTGLLAPRKSLMSYASANLTNNMDGAGDSLEGQPLHVDPRLLTQKTV